MSALTENSNAAKYLKIGDQIIAVNEKKYLDVPQNEWCNILEKGLFHENKNKISISIIRNGEKMVFQLEKKALILR